MSSIVKRITKPDVTNTDPKYWDKVLKSHNLSMMRGSDQDFIYYGGDSFDLQMTANSQIRKKAGKHKKPGHGPDD